MKTEIRGGFAGGGLCFSTQFAGATLIMSGRPQPAVFSPPPAPRRACASYAQFTYAEFALRYDYTDVYLHEPHLKYWICFA